MKPDSDADPAGVRVRRLIRVRARGKVLGPRPTSGTHSRGAAIGAHSRTAKPAKWHAAHASTRGNGLATRTASAGIEIAPASPSADTCPRIGTPTAGVALVPVRIVGPRGRGAPIGAHSRPAKPANWHAAHASTRGNGLATRTASAGIESAPASPSAEYSASIVPPNAGVAPASVRIFGSQVNIE